MTIGIHVVSNAALAPRLAMFAAPGAIDARPVDGSAAEPTGEDPAFDGHIGLPPYLRHQLDLLKLMEEQRTADRATFGKLAVVTQQMSVAQASAVRREGIDIFTGALTGAAIGLAVGSVGGVLSHRALSKQLGPGAPGSGALNAPPAGVSAGARRPADGASGAGIPSAPPGTEASSVDARAQTAQADMGSPSSWWDRMQMRFGTSYGVQARARAANADIDAAPEAWRRRSSIGDASAAGAPELANPAPSPASIRSAATEREAADLAPASRRSSIVADANEPNADIVAAPVDAGAATATAGAPTGAHSPAATPPVFSATEMLRASRGGAVGHSLAGNAANLGGVASSGGQMAASMERANAGLLQTSGMTSDSTKNNRGEEARGGNEAVARIQATLRELNQITQQTMSQIAASIRA